ncbi:hypothetical protein ATE84_1628 [Aquimarina sp. MAR_2010_214]|uniref:hypothetical protein n=1 Tax=Aquimarina sp. MAR_2010_214 TaxID=1250026 RepID=UPI000C701117|nr:hypothetical protein [Aquimarina sp. MAR_2010_214]PKV49596.1 hypothetical protein ATE84_1628 [Aquimarina sp. MAR_2010_214]
MISIKNIIKELNVFLQKQTTENNYIIVVSYLLDNYMSLISDLIIVDFSVTEKEHHLSFKKSSEDFIFLALTRKYIELRFLSHEQMVFFDETEKFEKLEVLLRSFFKGEYQIEIQRNKNGKSIYKQIKWLNKDLELFNEEYELSSSKEVETIDNLKGIDFTSDAR